MMPLGKYARGAALTTLGQGLIGLSGTLAAEASKKREWEAGAPMRQIQTELGQQQIASGKTQSRMEELELAKKEEIARDERLFQELMQKPHIKAQIEEGIRQAVNQAKTQEPDVPQAPSQYEQVSEKLGGSASPQIQGYLKEQRGIEETKMKREQELSDVESERGWREGVAEKGFEHELELENIKQKHRENLAFIEASIKKETKKEPKTLGGVKIKSLDGGQAKEIAMIVNTAATIQKIEKAMEPINTLKFGPIKGGLLSKNPYDKELKQLEFLVNTIVPGMARGIFKEVGVLTDQDIKYYKNLLPSVKQTPELANTILQEIKSKVNEAYKITLETYKNAGRDVSGFEYDTIWDFTNKFGGGGGEEEEGWQNIGGIKVRKKK
jgi:hypothetical protein